MADRTPGLSADRFIFLCALAFAGGTIAYVPLLTTLLPARVEGLAGRAAGVDWLAWISLSGAVAASVGGILFGWLSDVTGNRRGWIAAGLVLTTGLLLSFAGLTRLPDLILVIILWQLSLNMMLGPLSAWAADVVPDDRKGLLGGLLAFAPGIGALAGAVVTQPGLAAHGERLWAVAGLVLLCVVPLLLVRPPPLATAGASLDRPDRTGRAFRMWVARLGLQIAEAALFAYLLFWLSGLSPLVSEHDSARLFAAVMIGSVPVALLAGRWSDRRNRPFAPLIGAALVSALGLLAMALAHSLLHAVAAYALFGVASAVFLALHAAQTLRILPRADRRGRDLGLFNLANTAPMLMMPVLAMTLVPAVGYRGLFLVLALLAAAAGLLLAWMARED